MDRFERYSVYLISWGKGAAPVSPVLATDAAFPGVALASGIGCYQHATKAPLMSLDAFDQCAEDLAKGRAWSSAETEDDDRDVGPSARDERIAAEAHARLSKLILAGGHVETGGRSLYESAADEIVRLNAELDLAQAGAGRWCAELQQAKEALEQARAKVEHLRGVVVGADERRKQDEAKIEYFRAEVVKAREQGAAEMREQAAAVLDAVADLADSALSGLEARRYRALATRIRALYLSGAPDAAQAIAGERAAAKLDPASEREERKAHGVGEYSTMFMGGRWNPPRKRALGSYGDPAGLSAEDAETLRGAGWTQEIFWMAPGVGGAVVNVSMPAGLRIVLQAIAEIRASAKPAPARGTPGKATGAEAAGTGLGSVAEDRGAAQGPSAELAKPTRVEIGQRWRIDSRDLSGRLTDYTVDAASDIQARLLSDHGNVRFTPTDEMLTSLRWTFLGPAPQDPPKREDEREVHPAELVDRVVRELGKAYGGTSWARPTAARVLAHVDAFRRSVDASEHTLHDEQRRVRLTCPKGADARAVAAACVELLGLSSDEVHGGNVVEAFEAGVAEGERRAKGKAAEIAAAWDGQRDEWSGASSDEKRRLDAGKASRFMLGFLRGCAARTATCADDIRGVFGIEPADPGKPPTGEPAPEADTASRAIENAPTDDEPGCGGPREACARPGCDECGMPATPSDRRPHGAARDALLELATRWWDDAKQLRANAPDRPDGLIHLGKADGLRKAHDDLRRSLDEPASDAPRPAIPRLVPVAPGPLGDLANRIADVLADAFAGPSDGELRAPPAAARVLKIVDDFLQGAPAVAEAQDERWRPGAVWESLGTTRLILCGVHVGAHDMMARFAGHPPVRQSDMTEANGWRYVGPAKSG